MAKLSFYLRRQWLSLILGAMLTVLIASLIGGPMGPRDLANLRRHRRELEARRDELRAEQGRLAERIDRLRNDDAYIQRLIRSELGYARPGELVYRFSNQDAAQNR